MKKSKIILMVLVICLAWFVAGHFIVRNYHEKVRSKNKMYCYHQFWKVVNPVLFVKKKKYIDSLIIYYQKIENGDSNPIFNFPPLSLPYDTRVYVLAYERDSSIAKVICYYDWGKQGSFVKGYVYSNTLHNNPPPESLIKRR